MEGILGSIIVWPAIVIPKNWLPCDGRLLQIAQNQALHSLLGINYGGDGQSTFALPDLRGRVPMGVSATASAGAAAGAETITLDQSNTPAHSHALRAVSAVGTSTSFTNVLLAATGTAPHTPAPPAIYGPAGSPVGMPGDSIGSTGGSPHNNMQPSLVLNFLICVAGHYPSRH